MDYLGDKLNALTSETVTGINELKHKRKRQQLKTSQTKDKTQDPIGQTELSQLETSNPMRQQANIRQDYNSPPATGIYGFDLSRVSKGPLSGGIPFGGDSSPDQFSSPPPPVGFKPLPISDDRSTTTPVDSSSSPSTSPKKQLANVADDEGSSLSLYEGDTWSRLWFQRVMVLTLLRLLLFVRKIYEDYSAFRLYATIGLAGHSLISAATLFLPTLVFTIYRIARYLQIALPSVRALTPAPASTQSSAQSQLTNPINTNEQRHKTSRDLEDTQSRRALMSSPTNSIPQQQQQQVEAISQQEEDGLATARQTPTNLNEEYHDTQSDQPTDLQQIDPNKSTTTDLPSAPKADEKRTKSSSEDDIIVDEKVAGRKSQEPRLESVDVNKLGNLPDKQTTRIILGTSEQILHGILFIFWQLKRQVDVVGYLVERSCLWRRPKEKEKQQMLRLRFSGDGLEWFQDFYAAFLAILVQVYSLATYWTSNANQQPANKVNDTGSLVAASKVPGDSSEVSGKARALGSIINTVTATGKPDGNILVMSEIVVSCLVVVSLLVAVRRFDDGPLTLGLSMLGWGSIFAARIIIIALSFVHIGWKIMLPLVFCHIAAISLWIYKISLDSHNGKPDESEEHRWTTSPAVEDATINRDNNNKQLDDETRDGSPVTSSWSIMEHLTLICQITTLFAIPSLFYWPIMFNMKLHARPFKYLALIMSENSILIAAIWYHISSLASSSTMGASTSAQWYLLGTVGACSIVGFVFVALYIACKPSLTEYFARADEIINEAEKSGIYYEFCSRVFKMPDLTKHAFTRLMNQHEETIVEVTEQEERESLAEVQLD